MVTASSGERGTSASAVDAEIDELTGGGVAVLSMGDLKSDRKAKTATVALTIASRAAAVAQLRSDTLSRSLTGYLTASHGCEYGMRSKLRAGYPSNSPAAVHADADRRLVVQLRAG